MSFFGDITFGLADEIYDASGLKKAKKPKLPTYQVSGAPSAANATATQWALGQQAPEANVTRLGATKIDQSQIDRMRQRADSARIGQVGATNMLLGAARGTAPSAAQAQLQQGTEAALRGQMSAANSARGGAAAQASAQRAAAQQGSQLMAAGAQNAAILRAQEMAQARGQYADQANALRGQDFLGQQAETALAGQQAQLYQQGALANQQALNTGALADQQAQLGVLGLQSQAQQASAGRELDLERLKMEALYGPNAARAGMYGAESARNAQAWGGLMNAGGAVLGKI